MKIAILTKKNYSSPLILAESLQLQLKAVSIKSSIYFELDVLNRLVSYKHSKLSFQFWVRRKLKNFFADIKFVNELKKYDAVVISECIPNAFLKALYNIEKLQQIIKKPIFLYEVYALENAPTQMDYLQKTNNALLDRYDGHLAVSPVTEIKKNKVNNLFCLGILSNSWNLKPQPKKELLALVDFAQPGFETYRAIQIEQLKKAGIAFISLERRYTIEEIRKLYEQVSIYFMQSFEAFGLPILECLCVGAQVFAPHSSWPMSWRLNEKPEIHGTGVLPACFTIYENEKNLLEQLIFFKNKFNNEETPKKSFNNFINNYPSFYNGNSTEINKFIDYVKMYKK